MGGTVIALTMPFENLHAWAQVLFYVAFGLIIVMLAWTTVLFVLSRKALRSRARSRRPGGRRVSVALLRAGAERGAVTIADSVERLLTVEAREQGA